MAAYSVRTEVVKGGISFGSALAIAISWTKSQSVLWAISEPPPYAIPLTAAKIGLRS